MSIPRGVMVIDLFGLDVEHIRLKFPEVYQHILQTVKPDRDTNNRATYRDNWWLFGEPRKDLRPALRDLTRYIATVETAKHRVFQFLDASILPDNMLVAVGSNDAFELGVLSSRLHVAWALLAGGTLEDRPRYNKSRCFDPFPFPDCSDALKDKIRAVAEEMDAHRKARQAEHPKLTLTQMYNVLEKLRDGSALGGRLDKGESPGAIEEFERIKREGLVLILKELHDKLDVLVFEAYGWPATLSDEDIIARLVALNKERAAEEKKGLIRWLRPDYQIPRFGSEAEQAALKAARDDKRKSAQDTLELDDDGEADTKAQVSDR